MTKSPVTVSKRYEIYSSIFGYKVSSILEVYTLIESTEYKEWQSLEIVTFVTDDDDITANVLQWKDWFKISDGKDMPFERAANIKFISSFYQNALFKHIFSLERSGKMISNR